MFACLCSLTLEKKSCSSVSFLLSLWDRHLLFSASPSVSCSLSPPQFLTLRLSLCLSLSVSSSVSCSQTLLLSLVLSLTLRLSLCLLFSVSPSVSRSLSRHLFVSLLQLWWSVGAAHVYVLHAAFGVNLWLYCEKVCWCLNSTSHCFLLLLQFVLIMLLSFFLSFFPSFFPFSSWSYMEKKNHIMVSVK